MISELEALWVFIQMMSGLNNCHQLGIFHGDIKPENLLVKGGIVKLTDFSIHDPNSSPLGTIGSSSVYAAPELQSTSDLSSSFTRSRLSDLDVWASGVTLFVMCAGFTPWHSASPTDGNYARFLRSPDSFFPSFFSQNLKNLISKMLSPNPNARPSVQQCLSHAWITDSYRQSFSLLNRFISLTSADQSNDKTVPLSPSPTPSPISGKSSSSRKCSASKKSTMILTSPVEFKRRHRSESISLSFISVSSLKHGKKGHRISWSPLKLELTGNNNFNRGKQRSYTMS
jgi:serine/threonine protein kinase